MAALNNNNPDRNREYLEQGQGKPEADLSARWKDL